MTQIALRGSEIVKELKDKDKKIMRTGGFTIMNLPVKRINLPDETELVDAEMFGYPCIINYNKHRENQHRIDKFNQKIRATNRNIKNKGLRQSGLTHNIIQTGVKGDFKS